ncbi:hypothetical protein [Rickettsiella endosymbiont of Aleochara curtula]|uniref:hypothetical protein n=1 Tax=Rickettsiella endosymbiont of Aleochara curtula TaxID=3077936 RepID=UPI00313ECB9C
MDIKYDQTVLHLSDLSKKNNFNNISIHTLLRSRIKRAGDDETLVEATAKNQYTYWLSQEDIAEIARLKYNNYHGESHAE